MGSETRLVRLLLGGTVRCVMVAAGCAEVGQYYGESQQAAEELARIIPSKDLKKILPAFNNLLKACVACHLEYKVRDN